tara:strand:- start:205 stop:1038 length:834 start_codon:yes stop_codon:yes gene_type:complete
MYNNEENIRKTIKKLENNMGNYAEIINSNLSRIKVCVLGISNFLILNAQNLSPYKDKLIWEDDTIIIFDENYSNIKNFLEGKEVEGVFLNKVLQLATTRSNDQEYIYDLLYSEQLKSFHFKEYNLLDPKREFFLLWDEISPRYRKGIKLKKRNKIKIKDSSALLFKTEDGKRFIDFLNPEVLYVKGNKAYKTKGLMKEVISTKEKGKTLSVDKNGKIKYYETVLKEGVNLRDLEYYGIEEAEGKEFYLEKRRSSFILKDEEGEIGLNHPDLLIYLLE